MDEYDAYDRPGVTRLTDEDFRWLMVAAPIGAATGMLVGAVTVVHGVQIWTSLPLLPPVVSVRVVGLATLLLGSFVAFLSVMLYRERIYNRNSESL